MYINPQWSKYDALSEKEILFIGFGLLMFIGAIIFIMYYAS